jgi:hypothetical protein
MIITWAQLNQHHLGVLRSYLVKFVPDHIWALFLDKWTKLGSLAELVALAKWPKPSQPICDLADVMAMLQILLRAVMPLSKDSAQFLGGMKDATYVEGFFSFERRSVDWYFNFPYSWSQGWWKQLSKTPCGPFLSNQAVFQNLFVMLYLNHWHQEK